MRRSGCWLALSLITLTTLAAGGEMKLAWQIGKADNDTAEFALGRDGYPNYSRDGLFIVGKSDPAKDWPYTHPGPADTWAGGRARTFTILFGLKGEVGAGRLVVDLADTHGIRPPSLRITVNGKSFEHTTPKGGTDASITGTPAAGKEHVFAIALPAGVLRAGLNEITITNYRLSWLLYDWLGLEVAGEVETAPAEGALLRSARMDRWLSRSGGRLAHACQVTFVCIGGLKDLALKADGATKTLSPKPGVATVELRLPPVKAAAERSIALVSAGKTLDTLSVTQRPTRERELADYVDPILGTTTSRWMLYPGPSMPFGMVKLSPDNQNQGWMAGYEYNIENVSGFSHLHSWTMGGLLTMPTTGKLVTVPGDQAKPDEGYRSRIRHETEVASPGYYAVTLDDTGIRAELTCTTRAGLQRYTFPEADDARVLVDLHIPTEYGFTLHDARITKVSDTEIVGYSKQRSGRGAPYQEFTLHFVARTSKPFASMDAWVGSGISRDARQVAGKGDVGAALNFATKKGDQILLQTGISLVSIDQARLNLETEMKPFGWDFDACHAAARKVWTDLLRTIEVEGGTEADRVKFYTNLYRSYCARTLWSDVNGKYVDMYEKVQQLPDPASPVYGCDAFWNTFWNLNQLWVLATPDVASKWVRSLLEIYDKGGWLAKGPTGIEYSSIMVASHEIPLIVAAYQAGIRDYDVAKAYEAMRHCQTTPGRPHPGGGHVGNRQLDPYMKLGYVPVEKGPVSNTLEYAYDDWCVAQMAKALGKTDDYKTFLKRARSYKNVYDPSVGYARQKHADGRWVKDFNPFSGRGYVEGNAWQYTWFVPQDVAGLIGLMGGRADFNRRLVEGLEKASPRFTSRTVNHGNQPNMQSSWLFNYSGAPWLAQHWTREILDHYYGLGPADGYPGDEDQGQMGAWFVMSAIGLFQMDGGCAVRPIYEVASPLFERVVIHLDPRYYKGKQFVIEARNASRANRYIQSATLDGKPLTRPWLYQADLLDGGTLILELGPEPNEAWGSKPEDAPPSIPRP